MDIRCDVFHQILNYRRKSFRFPVSQTAQLHLVLKFYVYEYQRRVWCAGTRERLKDHLASITLLESLYSTYLERKEIDFAKTEGWDIKKNLKSTLYCYNDENLNRIHNK